MNQLFMRLFFRATAPIISNELVKSDLAGSLVCLMAYTETALRVAASPERPSSKSQCRHGAFLGDPHREQRWQLLVK